VRQMPRRKPFTLPLTAAEQQFVERLHEIQRQALDDIGRGDYTLLEKMREDASHRGDEAADRGRLADQGPDAAAGPAGPVRTMSP
jgi:hypothetical protein